MVASIAATLRGRERAEMFHHSVRQETVHRVASIILLSVSALVVATFLLLITENSIGRSASFIEVAFEATSAFGTVGLSLGLTPELSDWGRLIIPALMFFGRLGPVTIVMSAAQPTERAPYGYPEGHIIVG
jgi:trk system potassium uptake protein TrkH